MSYNDIEVSTEDGLPIELYEFAEGLQRWRFATCAGQIVRFDAIFEPAPIERSQLEQTNELEKSSLRVELPRDNSFAVRFLSYIPDRVVTLTIFRGHAGMDTADYVVFWKGRMVSSSASGNKISFELESVFTSIRRAGLRARYELNCRHVLYQNRCGVDKELYRVNGTVSEALGTELGVAAVASAPDGWYTGGFAVTEDGSARFIIKHEADRLYLNWPFQELAAGDPISVYPGCDHLKSTCHSKYNNVLNFGGFPHIPERNPFDGSSIV